MTVRSERGTTILEALIATMVVSVVAVGVFTAFAIGLRAAALAGSLTVATGIAEEGLATLAASPCGASYQSGAGAADPAADAAPAVRSRFHRETSARPVAGTGLWDLAATVSWTQERRERRVTLVTLRHVSAACEIAGDPW
jgi:hypothetical protein